MNGEGGAGRVALERDPPAVPLDNLFDERQAQSGADHARIGIAFQAIELFEDSFARLFRNAEALVTHADQDILVIEFRGNNNLGLRRAVLDRVAQQVVDGLCQKLFVGAQNRRVRTDL